MIDEKDSSQNIFCKAVIFDMDGTLIESTNADFLAWQKVFSDYNKILTFQDYSPMLGMRSYAVVQDLLKIKDEKEQAIALSNKSKYFRGIIEEQGIETVPYVLNFLKQIRGLGIPMALATSSRREKTKMVLEKVELLSYFKVILTAEDVSNGKPFPDVFLKAASLLNLPVENCIVFEDAVSGVKAAKSASMKCVAIATNHNSHLLDEADLVIESFKDLNFIDLCNQLEKVMA
ncbi:MAG: HAD family phosphatase [Ginsengibacter sp.]